MLLFPLMDDSINRINKKLLSEILSKMNKNIRAYKSFIKVIEEQDELSFHQFLGLSSKETTTIKYIKIRHLL